MNTTLSVAFSFLRKKVIVPLIFLISSPTSLPFPNCLSCVLCLMLMFFVLFVVFEAARTARGPYIYSKPLHLSAHSVEVETIVSASL